MFGHQICYVGFIFYLVKFDKPVANSYLKPEVDSIDVMCLAQTNTSCGSVDSLRISTSTWTPKLQRVDLVPRARAVADPSA